MSSHLLDGILLPDRVAGHVALEFCNTRAGWGTATPREYLTSPAALTAWAADNALLPNAGGVPVGIPALGAPAVGPAPVVVRAIALRSALYACALGRADDRDWDHLATAARAARTLAVLRPGPTGRPARWVLPTPAPTLDPELVLHAVALTAEQLLTSPLAAGVAACPGQDCGWLFVDPRGRRRWCSMAVCGNRAKARRHAQRSAPTGPGSS